MTSRNRSPGINQYGVRESRIYVCADIFPFYALFGDANVFFEFVGFVFLVWADERWVIGIDADFLFVLLCHLRREKTLVCQAGHLRNQTQIQRDFYERNSAKSKL